MLWLSLVEILKKKRSEELVLHIHKAKKFLENTGRILLKTAEIKGTVALWWNFHALL